MPLDNANIHFHFDNLEGRRRLSVAAHPVAVAVSDLKYNHKGVFLNLIGTK